MEAVPKRRWPGFVVSGKEHLLWRQPKSILNKFAIVAAPPILIFAGPRSIPSPPSDLVLASRFIRIRLKALMAMNKP